MLFRISPGGVLGIMGLLYLLSAISAHSGPVFPVKNTKFHTDPVEQGLEAADSWNQLSELFKPRGPTSFASSIRQAILSHTEAAVVS
ncbi:MAG: hypothetical protein KGQ59_11855, partial [Bdellovibrionales bacterium]|nr:hypothetical protein [Bdellovibrionales bacterium]